MPIRAVSFDFDGTLARAGWRRVRLLPAVLRRRGALLHLLRAIEAHRSPPQRRLDLDDSLLAHAAKESGLPRAILKPALYQDLDVHFAHALRDAPTPPAIAELLDRCDRLNLPRAIVSDHPALNKLHNRRAGWTAVVSCRALGALKPSPDGLWAAAAQMGVPPAEMLHVGDRWETDGRAAAAAGCPFAHVSEVEQVVSWLIPNGGSG